MASLQRIAICAELVNTTTCLHLISTCALSRPSQRVIADLRSAVSAVAVAKADFCARYTGLQVIHFKEEIHERRTHRALGALGGHRHPIQKTNIT